MPRQTIVRPTSFSGIGLHSGHFNTIALMPSTSGSGIRFSMLGSLSKDIQVKLNNVSSVHRQINLNQRNDSIHTTEHLLSALRAFHVSDCRILTNGSNLEIPCLDGGSKTFVQALNFPGMIKKTQGFIPMVSLTKKFVLSNTKHGRIEILPNHSFSVEYQYFNENEGFQSNAYFHVPDYVKKPDTFGHIFTKHIAQARTFGFTSEIQMLHKKKLALGANLTNCLILKGNKALNMHLAEEAAKHKILDFIGSLAFLPFIVLGHIKLFRSGHTLDIQVVKSLLELFKESFSK